MELESKMKGKRGKGDKSEEVKTKHFYDEI